jgi:hypothetical protein
MSTAAVTASAIQEKRDVAIVAAKPSSVRMELWAISAALIRPSKSAVASPAVAAVNAPARVATNAAPPGCNVQ